MATITITYTTLARHAPLTCYLHAFGQAFELVKRARDQRLYPHGGLRLNDALAHVSTDLNDYISVSDVSSSSSDEGEGEGGGEDGGGEGEGEGKGEAGKGGGEDGGENGGEGEGEGGEGWQATVQEPALVEEEDQ